MNLKNLIYSAILSLLIAACSGLGSRSIVPDPGGGLVWQAGDGGEMTWKEAQRYCLDLTLDGRSNWRLPSLSELERAYSIKSKFPGSSADSYWSSKSGGRFNAGYLKFDFGVTGYRKKTYPAYVRCVHQSD